MSVFKSVAISEFGAASVLTIQQNPITDLPANEVRVEVAFASINPIDLKTRAGLGWAAQANKDNLPWVPGYDIAGTVIEVGTAVDSIKVGDRVAGMIGFPTQAGAYSQIWQGSTEALVTLDVAIDLEQAAAFPLAGLTAYQGLFKFGALGPGQKVLIVGAAGGVGHLAVQFAAFAGCEVIASCGPKDIETVKALGATKAISYEDGHLIAAEKNIDLVFDLVGGVATLTLLELGLRAEKLVTVPTVTADVINDNCFAKGIASSGMLVESDPQLLAHLFTSFEHGLQVIINQIYPLTQANQAHADLESGKVKGKTLLKCN
ncbi:NADP-dependent oxidoreductase [Paraferrimonas sp. SM1919]|uniref:NADP-dependent oxidoreductase n=1 Tax=Paraferrimonas sp. SM1919 TaxID=2662263 RepID=UPI0013D57B11|nr:NADP-dependent oxidoreductase [Paraferrimonas sp. SM1919]